MNAVQPCSTENRSLVVPGRRHGKARWKTMSGNIQLVLSAYSEEERDAWMDSIRLRISPWQVLRERAKGLSGSAEDSVPMHELTRRVEAMYVNVIGTQHMDALADSPSTGVRDVSSTMDHFVSVSNRVYSRTQKVDLIDKFSFN